MLNSLTQEPDPRIIFLNHSLTYSNNTTVIIEIRMQLRKVVSSMCMP